MGEKLDSLEAALDAHAERLSAEVRRAGEALAAGGREDDGDE
jgi:hypothetical protein